MSSTLKIPTISGISTGDLTKYSGDNLDSLEDLNKEIEKLCPFNTNNFIHPHDMKLVNSRYCDIFSRQSMESDDNSSPDDEERINFMAIPQTGCEILQLVPKKPIVSMDNNKTMYQPCTNTIVQLKQSSYSAFRELSEFRSVAKFDEACGGEDDEDEAASTSHMSSSLTATTTCSSSKEDEDNEEESGGVDKKSNE